MKGAESIVSAIILATISIAIISTVSIIGFPIFEKSRGVLDLETSENFIHVIDSKIADDNGIANSRGSNIRIPITINGEILFDNNILSLKVRSSSNIYSEGSKIALGRNSCDTVVGIWEYNTPGTICVKSECINPTRDQCAGCECNEYEINYELKYIELQVEETGDRRKIDLTGLKSSGGKGSSIFLEKQENVTESGVKKSKINVTIQS